MLTSVNALFVALLTNCFVLHPQEIKKLQRLRDQIKTWQGDSAIKDKTKLDANRKLIEGKMEKFKVCEKETKTKAFSKEGLAQDRTDPRQKQKEEINDWVKEAITKLKEQVEEMEAEIESLNSGKRKKRAEENPRVAELKEHMSRHDHHVQMLERVLRAVYNDAVVLREAKELKESVDYYIDSNQEPDFYEDDEMYDSLNLDALPTPAPASGRKPAKNAGREEDEPQHNTPSNSSDRGSARKGSTATNSPKHGSASKGRRSGGASQTGGRTVSPKTDSKSTSSERQSPTHTGSANREALSPRVFPGGPLMSSVVKTGSAAAAAKQATDPTPDPTVRQIFRSTPGPVEMPKAIPSPVGSAPQSRWNGVAPGSSRETSSVGSPRAQPGPSGAGGGLFSRSPVTPPAASSSDGRRASATTTAGVGSDLSSQASALDRAFLHLPEGSSSRPPAARNGTPNVPGAPRNPAQVPASFPQTPAGVFEKPEIFLKFDPDTLFFIFYYQQGTYQQYLAAQELKRQGWRFHKKYLTWFQRHDEPKLTTDEFENGTFIYFDYANVVYQGQGTGWCQRIKSEFIFEYRYLEDELV